MEKGKRTFVMIKPDGVARGLVGEIVARFERRGFRLAEARLMRISRETAEEHYAQHKGKPFFGELIDYITSGPVFAMILEADNAVELARQMIGATNPLNAAPGTIRADYAQSVEANVIHGADSDESAEREIRRFFGPQA
ncbi:MAG: nucleoside-diphosphate kinase [Thermobacillus sp. ZCTH02-B1]|uniref:nucleoside-diphosphate kinase n=1 Tax=Thermobacillus sp. ZCTH02-B1 TaxID=1858795 RepID=UPI000B57F260|nr:nucleoside-diphosphate kinase [Thermobacillus sp. ZCTH02-B1]OUM94101.1 MAG: nucleoside-diphosphate kinase [Thermobacillus sp. ZCTH02-B1]